MIASRCDNLHVFVNLLIGWLRRLKRSERQISLSFKLRNSRLSFEVYNNRRIIPLRLVNRDVNVFIHRQLKINVVYFPLVTGAISETVEVPAAFFAEKSRKSFIAKITNINW